MTVDAAAVVVPEPADDETALETAAGADDAAPEAAPTADEDALPTTVEAAAMDEATVPDERATAGAEEAAPEETTLDEAAADEAAPEAAAADEAAPEAAPETVVGAVEGLVVVVVLPAVEPS